MRRRDASFASVTSTSHAASSLLYLLVEHKCFTVRLALLYALCNLCSVDYPNKLSPFDRVSLHPHSARIVTMGHIFPCILLLTVFFVGQTQRKLPACCPWVAKASSGAIALVADASDLCQNIHLYLLPHSSAPGYGRMQPSRFVAWLSLTNQAWRQQTLLNSLSDG